MFVNEFEAIRNEREYEAALAQVEKLMTADLTEAESTEFTNLVDLVERYEDETEPMGYPTLAATIEFHMDQFGLSLNDLATVIGSIEEAADVLAGKGRITQRMAAELSEKFDISPPPNYKFRSASSSATPSTKALPKDSPAAPA